MSEAGTLDAAVPPHVQLIQMATAYWMSRAVYMAAAADAQFEESLYGEVAKALRHTH